MAYVSSNYDNNPNAKMGTWVGDGQCVAHERAVAGAPRASSWRRGALVKSNTQIRSGTVIATFNQSGHYSGHTVIYRGQSMSGIEVTDQWESTVEPRNLFTIEPSNFAAGIAILLTMETNTMSLSRSWIAATFFLVLACCPAAGQGGQALCPETMGGYALVAVALYDGPPSDEVDLIGRRISGRRQQEVWGWDLTPIRTPRRDFYLDCKYGRQTRGPYTGKRLVAVPRTAAQCVVEGIGGRRSLRVACL